MIKGDPSTNEFWINQQNKDSTKTKLITSKFRRENLYVHWLESFNRP